MDKIHQTLEHLPELTVIHIIYQRQMELVVILYELFQARAAAASALQILPAGSVPAAKGLFLFIQQPLQGHQQFLSLLCIGLRSRHMDAEPFDCTANLDALLHVLLIELSQHETLAGHHRNIAVLAQTLDSLPHGRSGYPDFRRHARL